MKIAIMQPYFFPYLGYWQLINAVDCFVLLDDVQYMRHGWINRNRILKHGGGWQYILVPIKKHDKKELIKNVQAHPEKEWKELIISQLSHYKKFAPYFDEANNIIKEILYSIDDQNIGSINFSIIRKMCTYLNIEKEIILSSGQDFDYTEVCDPGEWALRISEQMKAAEYINPSAGAKLFDQEKFISSNIKLSFLESQETIYSQPDMFIPSLSIIDVLMFNGVKGTMPLLRKYKIESS